jgi:hypothetical protein
MRHLFASMLVLFSAASAFAQADLSAPGSQEGLAGLYAGQLSVLRDYDSTTPMVGAEYRWADRFYGIRPTAGGFFDGNGALYGYAGINWDLPLGLAPIFITPSFVAGGYHEGGSKKLGYAVEFRSTIEVAYQFESHERLGLQLSHLSNAGLGNKNPGTETFQAVYIRPMSF